MKILLINPSFFEVWGKNRSLESALPPINLLYLAAIAEKEGHKVKVLDMHADNLTFKEAVNESKKNDLIGITCVTPTANIAYKLSQNIKEEDSDVNIVVGGPHPSALPEEPLKTNSIDFVITGEGESTFSDLIKCLEKGTSPNKVKGIYFKKGKKISHTPPHHLITNLDSLPFPAYNLINIKKYFYPYQKKRPLSSILTSRGCPNTCTFCNKNIFGHSFRFRSAENVIKEILYMIEKYKIKEFLVYDDNFTVIKKRALEICQRINDEKLDISISFENGLRVDKIDYEILKALKKAGCYLIGYGIESSDQRVLDSVKKNISMSQIRNAVMLTKKCGIGIVGYFIIGFPSDTEATIKSTIKFAKDLSILSKFSILTPFPGTELFKMLDKQGLILTYDWSKYIVHQEPIFRHPNLSPEKIFELYREAYRTVYSNPKLILQEISSVQSVTHFFRLMKGGWNLFNEFFK